MNDTAAVASPEDQQLASEIRTRIGLLDEMFGESLVGEMDALKVVLKANPSASALLFDQDVGNLVRNLQRTVVKSVEEAKAKKESSGKGRKPKSKPMTPEELNAALMEED